MTLTGLPAILWTLGIVVIGSVPVWFGAQVTGAGHPTLLRSVLALIVGMIGSIAGIFFGGPLAILLVPLSFICAFKFVLDMSFLGAFMLGVIALVGYFLMARFAGGTLPAQKDPQVRSTSDRIVMIDVRRARIHAQLVLASADGSDVYS